MSNDFVWDYDAAGDLMLRSDEIAAVCAEQAERMTKATGVEYIPDVVMGKTRVVAAGRKKSDTPSDNVCPKCGRWHPNCNCNK